MRSQGFREGQSGQPAGKVSALSLCFHYLELCVQRSTGQDTQAVSIASVTSALSVLVGVCGLCVSFVPSPLGVSCFKGRASF